MANSDIIPADIDLTELELPKNIWSQFQNNKGLSKEEKAAKEGNVFFNDGTTRIDFVLTYVKPVMDVNETMNGDEKFDLRCYYLNSIMDLGVEIEMQKPEDSPDKKTTYLKLHASWKAMSNYAEKINLRVPIHEQDTTAFSLKKKIFKLFKMRDITAPNFPEKYKAKNYYTAIFKPEKFDSYIGNENKETFFTDAQRSLTLYNLLLDAPYAKYSSKTGIETLLCKRVFTSAYPLHDGIYYVKPNSDPTCFRQSLFREWASPWAFYKTQPLDEIREYFGEKIALYFAFFGNYIKWLHLPSIVGIIIFIYGLTTLGTQRNPLARQVCNDPPTDYYMCPICNGSKCDFWFLNSACTAIWFSLLFDNEGTLLFAIFMSFWCTMFLESWKREQSTLQYEWDLLGFEEEEKQPRPEYELGARNEYAMASGRWKSIWFNYDPVTKLQEYKQPYFVYLSKIVGATSLLVVMLAVVVAFVIAVIFYKLLVRNSLSVVAASNRQNIIVSLIGIVVIISAAILQLVFIYIMNKIYTFLAQSLNNWELHRTQVEHEDGLRFKMFLFQCVNLYSSIFYIAFIKGKIFVNYPGVPGFKLEECQPYGCLLELCLQLAIVFLGKQTLNNAKELGIPFVKYVIKRALNWWRAREQSEDDEEAIYTRYTLDFDLPPEGSLGLFSEYLKLISQFGFVTLFVASFPLAPFFALLNNYAEIRLNAFKYLCLQRRIVAIRAVDIGLWYAILDIIAKCAVISNAFLIAFTATLIDRIAYASINPLGIATYNDLNGFYNWTLGEVPVRFLMRSETFPDPELRRLKDPNCNLTFLEKTLYGLECENYRPYEFNTTECCDCSNTTCNYSTPAPGLTCCQQVVAEAGKNETLASDQILNSNGTSSIMCDVTFLSQTLTCRFRGRFQPNPFFPDATFNLYYYRVTLAKFVFVLLFEHIVFILTAIIAWLIPDVPESIKTMKLRERHLTRTAFYDFLDREAASPASSRQESDY